MPKKKSRIVIDTNIWISFLLTKDYSPLDKIISSPNLTLIFSNQLIEEFIEVATRPKFSRYFSSADLEELLLQMKFHGKFITVTSSVAICRDAKDNFLLSLSQDGKATQLITGDKDLLDIKKHRGTQIVTLTKFLAQY